MILFVQVGANGNFTERKIVLATWARSSANFPPVDVLFDDHAGLFGLIHEKKMTHSSSQPILLLQNESLRHESIGTRGWRKKKRREEKMRGGRKVALFFSVKFLCKISVGTYLYTF